jgi:uncharacterized surface protein with fasciclin (FAS1) repeats
VRRITLVLLAVVSIAACAPPPPAPAPIPTDAAAFPTDTLQPIEEFNLPTNTPTPPGYAETVIAGTVAALTVLPLTPQPPTETPRPSITPSPAPSATPGPTATPTNTPTPTVFTVMQADPNLTTMAGFLERAGLANALDEPGGFTVFAPTNDAWATLDEGFVEGLLIDEQALTNIVSFHVAPRRISTDDINSTDDAFPTLLGVDYTPGAQGEAIQRTITTPTNGVIHVIDRVLTPPEG